MFEEEGGEVGGGSMFMYRGSRFVVSMARIVAVLWAGVRIVFMDRLVGFGVDIGLRDKVLRLERDGSWLLLSLLFSGASRFHSRYSFM